ncbi:MAG: hypothetical protein D6775_06765 [Caldilineae bacterium]|nr:MAG: hypothetical protein D6775_06765 [Caldilineae bacterium]
MRDEPITGQTATLGPVMGKLLRHRSRRLALPRLHRIFAPRPLQDAQTPAGDCRGVAPSMRLDRTSHPAGGRMAYLFTSDAEP